MIQANFSALLPDFQPNGKNYVYVLECQQTTSTSVRVTSVELRLKLRLSVCKPLFVIAAYMLQAVKEL